MKKMKKLLMLMAVAVTSFTFLLVTMTHGMMVIIGTMTMAGTRITTRAAGAGTRVTGTRGRMVRRTVCW